MAHRFALLASVLLSAFQTAWWPYAMSKARDKGISAHFQQICRLACVTGAMLAVIVGSIAPVLTWVMLPKEYTQCFRTSGLQVLGAVIHTYYYFPLVSLLVVTKMKLEVLGYVGGMIVTLLLDIVLVKYFGVPGAVVATIFGYLALTMIVGRLARREFDLGFPLRRIELFFTLSFAILALWLVVKVSTIANAVCLGLLTSILVLGAAYFTGMIKRHDFKLIQEVVTAKFSKLKLRKV